MKEYYDLLDSGIYLLAEDSLLAYFKIKYTESFQIMNFHNLLIIMKDFPNNL